MQLTSIRLIVRGAKACVEVHGVLTAGMVGIPVTIDCDGSWNGLTKNLVCRGGLGYENFKGVSRTIMGVGTTAKVAPEVMNAGAVLYLGIEGYNADGTLVIPTTWACCGIIQEGVKTEGGPSEDPTLPIWNQLQAQIGAVQDAVEEALKSGGTGGGYVLTEADKNEIAAQAAKLVDVSDLPQNGDGSKLCIIDITNGWSSMDKTFEEIQAAYQNGEVLVLYHTGHTLDFVRADGDFVFERHYVEGTKLVTDRCEFDEDMIWYVPRASVVDIPTDNHINELINAALAKL